MAARLTGRSGSVYAIEPNPDLIPPLRRHIIERNKIENVKIFNVGLSDREGRATIVASPGRLAHGWVRPGGVPLGDGERPIRLVRGDDILTDIDPSLPVIAKIDVEGHEVHAIRGLSGFLERRELAVICEVNREYLSRAGSTDNELFDLMKIHGFRAYKFDIDRGRWNQRLRLTRLDNPLSIEQYDILFLKAGTKIARRANILR